METPTQESTIVMDHSHGAGPNETISGQTLSHGPKDWQVYSREGKRVPKDT